MQVDVVDWSSRKAFSSPQMSMATGGSTTSISTVVVSPIDFNILSYHIPIQSFKEKMESKCKTKTESPQPAHSVHFPDDDSLVLVIEFEDDLESKETRTCYWEIFARDRARFKDRVEQTSSTLNPVLERDHRDRIYAKLYSIEDSSPTTASIPSSSNHQQELNGSGESCSGSGSSSTGKKSRRKRRKCKSHRK